MNGDVNIGNPGGSLHVNSMNSTVTGNNVNLTAASNISANGSFNASNGSISVATTNSAASLLLGGKYSAGGSGTSAAPGGQVVISVGTPQLVPGTNPGGVNTPGTGTILWGANSSSINGAGATVNVTSPGEVIFSEGKGEINLNAFPGSPVNLTAISYLVPRTVPGLELSQQEIARIGCLLFDGSLARGNDTEHLTLWKGQLLVRPLRDTDIDCGYSIVHLSVNTSILIERSERGLRVYCLADRNRNSPVLVENKYDGTRCAVYGGQKLIIGNDEASFEILRDDRVGERFVRSDSTRCQSVSEFSLPSLLKQHTLLHELRSSADPIAQSTHDQILKKAAALSIVQASHGPYKVYRRSTGIAI